MMEELVKGIIQYDVAATYLDCEEWTTACAHRLCHQYFADHGGYPCFADDVIVATTIEISRARHNWAHAKYKIGSLFKDLPGRQQNVND